MSLLLTVAALASLGSATLAWRSFNRPDPERLAEAELLVEGEWSVDLDEPSGDEQESHPESVLLTDARLVRADGDDAFYVQTAGQLLRSDADGDVVGIYDTKPSAADMAVSPDGQVAEPGILEERESDHFGRLVVDLPGSPDDYHGFEEGIEVVALAYMADGTLLFSSSFEETRIEAMTPEGERRRRLGPPGDETAEVQLDDRLGPIVSLVALPDDRVVFAADDNQLYLFDGERVTQVETSPEDLVRGAEDDLWLNESREPDMTALAPGPDGRVITVGLGPGDVPRISLLDVDTGEAEVLAELEGVEASSEEPVSAAAVGDDLIFLADGRLWKKEDVFG